MALLCVGEYSVGDSAIGIWRAPCNLSRACWTLTKRCHFYGVYTLCMALYLAFLEFPQCSCRLCNAVWSVVKCAQYWWNVECIVDLRDVTLVKTRRPGFLEDGKHVSIITIFGSSFTLFSYILYVFLASCKHCWTFLEIVHFSGRPNLQTIQFLY